MDEILFIDACVRPGSRTARLARHVLERLGGHVTRLDLTAADLRPLDLGRLERREALLRAGRLDDPMFGLARQFAAADVIALAAPFWDLSFPAIVKIYLENIMVVGLTFRYSPEGVPVGMCRARRLIYVTTAGGQLPERDGAFDYVSSLGRGFFGIPDTVRFYAEGLDIYGADVERLMQEAEARIDREMGQSNA